MVYHNRVGIIIAILLLAGSVMAAPSVNESPKLSDSLYQKDSYADADDSTANYGSADSLCVHDYYFKLSLKDYKVMFTAPTGVGDSGYYYILDSLNYILFIDSVNGALSTDDTLYAHPLLVWWDEGEVNWYRRHVEEDDFLWGDYGGSDPGVDYDTAFKIVVPLNGYAVDDSIVLSFEGYIIDNDLYDYGIKLWTDTTGGYNATGSAVTYIRCPSAESGDGNYWILYRTWFDQGWIGSRSQGISGWSFTANMTWLNGTTFENEWGPTGYIDSASAFVCDGGNSDDSLCFVVCDSALNLLDYTEWYTASGGTDTNEVSLAFGSDVELDSGKVVYIGICRPEAGDAFVVMRSADCYQVDTSICYVGSGIPDPLTANYQPSSVGPDIKLYFSAEAEASNALPQIF